MSSIIVFGTKEAVITKETLPNPDKFYGDSKLQAEQLLEKLQSESFNIVFVRPPMIYGKGSKGNYPRLAKLAKKTPIFPSYSNRRSMLHVDNLTELLRLLVDNSDKGYYHPQNEDYVNTSKLVNEIAAVNDHKVLKTKLFNPFITLVRDRGVVNKVFGDLYYEQAANEQFVFANGLQIVRQVSTPLVTLPLLLTGYGSIGMVLGTTLVNIIIELINISYSIRKLNMKFSFDNFDMELLKEMSVYSFYIFINMVVDQVNQNVDKTILGRYSGTLVTAIYSVGERMELVYQQPYLLYLYPEFIA